MRKYVQFITYIMSVLIVAFTIDRIAGLSIEKFLLHKQNNKYMYAYHGGGGEEIVVLGASRASHHYIPQIIEDSLGVKCFNYGCDGQNIYNQYALFNMLLNNAKNKPKLVLLEVASIDVFNSINHNTEKLSTLHPYFALDDSIKSVIKLQGKGVCNVLKISKLYSFNSILHDFFRTIVGVGEKDLENNGFTPLDRKWNKQIELKTEDNKEIDQTKVSYLNKFIECCKKDSISLIIINSPNFVELVGQSVWKPVVEETARKYGVTFYDFEQDTTFIANPEYFNEPFHLNVEGATLYTEKIIPIINRALLQ